MTQFTRDGTSKIQTKQHDAFGWDCKNFYSRLHNWHHVKMKKDTGAEDDITGRSRNHEMQNEVDRVRHEEKIKLSSFTSSNGNELKQFSMAVFFFVNI